MTKRDRLISSKMLEAIALLPARRFSEIITKASKSTVLVLRDVG